MNKTRTKTLSCALAACMALGVAGTAFYGLGEFVEAKAMDTTTTVSYPFERGTNAFRYAPTFTMAQEAGAGGNKWEYVEVKFDAGAVDLTSAQYLAVQIRLDQGNPGLTMGLIENGDRFNNSTDGNTLYFLSEDGTLSALSVLYSATNLGAGACGTLIMPISSLSWQWNNNGSNLSSATAFYYTTNTQYNYNYTLTIGEVGYYNGEPDAAGTTFTKLVDLSGGERAKSMYYVDSANADCMAMPSDAEKVEQTPPAIADYHFRTGDGAFVYGGDWEGPVTGDTENNWQTLFVKFDTATVDLSDATYLAIQYYAKKGSPGITFGLQNKDARYSVGASSVDGEPAYFAQEGTTTVSKVANVTFGAVTAGSVVGQKGILIIPMTSMAWQFGSSANKSLSAIDTLVLTTNSVYNYDFEIVVGEVGYYTGTAENPGALHKILTLDEEKTAFTATSDLESNRGTVSVIMPDAPSREMMGDVTLDFKADKMTEASFTEEGLVGGGIWTGGSYGKRELSTDTYGNQAVKFTALGTNPTGDGYCAFDLAASGGFTWENMKGVAFWARNDSDVEISFNIEVDCKGPFGAEGATISDRFNIKQGNRFYLYNIKTGRTSIYMTRPCATLPVGFEGWVFVPFTAFARADWSTNGVTQSQFMSEGSVVSYLALTVHAATYANKSFTVNNFGGYSTTPSMETAVISATGKTIPEMLGLNANEGEN